MSIFVNINKIKELYLSQENINFLKNLVKYDDAPLFYIQNNRTDN